MEISGHCRIDLRSVTRRGRQNARQSDRVSANDSHGCMYEWTSRAIIMDIPGRHSAKCPEQVGAT